MERGAGSPHVSAWSHSLNVSLNLQLQFEPMTWGSKIPTALSSLNTTGGDSCRDTFSSEEMPRCGYYCQGCPDSPGIVGEEHTLARGSAHAAGPPGSTPITTQCLRLLSSPTF